MTEKRFKVKQLIKYLVDFNPNAEIMNNINPSWFTGMGEEEIRNIENEKLNASKVWLFDDDDEEVEKMSKPRICVDFDGVLNTYTGWKGREELYKPQEGVYEFLEELDSKFDVVIFTTRDSELVWDWLEKYHLDFFVGEVTDIKGGAVAYIDDRALKFNGDYAETLSELKEFKTHWENEVIE